jgi:hypothetical protein
METFSSRFIVSKDEEKEECVEVGLKDKRKV